MIWLQVNYLFFANVTDETLDLLSKKAGYYTCKSITNFKKISLKLVENIFSNTSFNDKSLLKICLNLLANNEISNEILNLIYERFSYIPYICSEILKHPSTPEDIKNKIQKNVSLIK